MRLKRDLMKELSAFAKSIVSILVEGTLVKDPSSF